MPSRGWCSEAAPGLPGLACTVAFQREGKKLRECDWRSLPTRKAKVPQGKMRRKDYDAEVNLLSGAV